MATSVYFSEEQIQERIKSLAAEINEAYKDVDELIVIAILNGSFMFCADLVRHLTIPIRLDFMGATSYHVRKGPMI